METEDRESRYPYNYKVTIKLDNNWWKKGRNEKQFSKLLKNRTFMINIV